MQRRWRAVRLRSYNTWQCLFCHYHWPALDTAIVLYKSITNQVKGHLWDRILQYFGRTRWGAAVTHLTTMVVALGPRNPFDDSDLSDHVLSRDLEGNLAIGVSKWIEK